jgi:hypothetical protein
MNEGYYLEKKQEIERYMPNKKDKSSDNDESEPDDYFRNDHNQYMIGNQSRTKEETPKHIPEIKSNTLDEGTMAFIHWLNSTHKNSMIENPIVVKTFENDKCTVLWDSSLRAEVRVETKEGVPICQYCKADDCAHVGFTICLEQLHGRGETLESIEAEAEVEAAKASTKNKIFKI